MVYAYQSRPFTLEAQIETDIPDSGGSRGTDTSGSDSNLRSRMPSVTNLKAYQTEKSTAVRLRAQGLQGLIYDSKTAGFAAQGVELSLGS